MSDVQIALSVWCAIGVVCYFAARFAWQLSFECKPVTVGDLISCAFLMWVPPLTALAGFIWFLAWFIEDCSLTNPLRRWFATPIANPCQWFRRKRP